MIFLVKNTFLKQTEYHILPLNMDWADRWTI